MHRTPRLLIPTLAAGVAFFALSPGQSLAEAPAAAAVLKSGSTRPPKLIDDRQLKVDFEKKLGALKDDDQTRSGSELVKELREREGKTHAHRLATRPNTGEPLSRGEIYRRSLESSLIFGNIYKCDKCNNWHGNIAGGFILTADGLAVTNYHVMDSANAGAFGAMTADGNVYPVREVLAASKADDVALVQLDCDGDLTPFPVSPAALPGDDVIVVSHPKGMFYTLTEGVVSRYSVEKRKDRAVPSLEITADYAAGSSGSPIFDARGNVTGLVKSTRSLYYEEDRAGVQKNLQMVIKTCVPAISILRLLQPEDESKDSKRVSAE